MSQHAMRHLHMGCGESLKLHSLPGLSERNRKTLPLIKAPEAEKKRKKKAGPK